MSRIAVAATSNGEAGMPALTHSANSTLMLVILAAIAIAMFWRALLKFSIVIVVITVLIMVTTGLWVFMTGVHQVIGYLRQILG